MTDRLPQTPSQTIGPFFAYGLAARQYGYAYTSIVDGDLSGGDCPGERILISGRVLDGEGKPVSDALVEIRQADGQGNDPPLLAPATDRFAGFGRQGTGTDPGCRFQFRTIKPGAGGEGQAPHIDIILFMRGSLRQLHTRLYFPDEAAANAKDPVLQAVPAERRHTLVATKLQEQGRTEYRFDIYMQGEKETVFFEI